jgi:hypothetical protein
VGRYEVLHRIEAMDPQREFLEIYRLTATVEFPWDVNQALSFALFRTYAVPAIGRLLARTGEFTQRAQKRYDDTTLLLDAVLEHGTGSATGRAAVRRVNQMHRAWDVGQDDLRYVLSTFVVSPIRWLDAYGWRPLSEPERIASATTTASWAGTWGSGTSRRPGRSSAGTSTRTRPRTSPSTPAAARSPTPRWSCSPRSRSTGSRPARWCGSCRGR